MESSLDFDQLHGAFLERRYFSSLDGLRAVSIVPVVWHHATPRPYPGFLGRGPIGVDLFFAISGFLITTLLVRERARSGHIVLTAFYARRSLRIFPLYYLVLGLHCLFALYWRPAWEPSRHFLERWPFYATYSANWFVGDAYTGPTLFAFAWSLCTEEQFYAFWAPVLRWCKSMSAAAVMMGLWLVTDLYLEGRLWGSPRAEPSVGVTIVTSFASSIGWGALLALAMHHRRCATWLWPWLGRRHSASLVAVLVLSLIVVPWAPLPWLHFGLALLVCCCCMRRDHGLASLLDRPIVVWVGQITYGIYLWHVPVIGAARAVVPSMRENAAFMFLLALPFSVALAWMSHRAFEKPLMQLGNRFSAQR